jgi:hypothetical protein
MATKLILDACLSILFVVGLTKRERLIPLPPVTQDLVVG